MQFIYKKKQKKHALYECKKNYVNLETVVHHIWSNVFGAIHSGKNNALLMLINAHRLP